MTCPPVGPSLDICPNRDQIRTQYLASLPRGRAWQSNEGGPQPGSVLYRFWDACAETRRYVEKRACDLRKEFFCATHVETDDQWMFEYGLPDGCDPYPNLCEKVAAEGGATCAYLEDRAAAAGWDIECVRSLACGPTVGKLKAGQKITGGGTLAGTLRFRVDLSNSPAFHASYRRTARAGTFRSGQRFNCPPDIGSLECLLTRIVPAHAKLIFIIVGL